MLIHNPTNLCGDRTVRSVGMLLIKLAVAILVCVGSASLVAAEDVTVHLKSGETLTGRLVDVAPDHVTVDFGRGKPTRFARANVKKLERDVVVEAEGDGALGARAGTGGIHELPMIPGPGAIARIRATGPDATRLRPGDWVYCDPTVRSRDNALAPDIALQGLTGGNEAGMLLQRYFHDGAWAEQMRLPTENVIPIGDIDANDAGRWCALGTLLVPYGGFLAANFQPGEIALVNGATGSFGSAAVAVALGMGAQCVVATGRNEQALGELRQRFGARVRTVPMRGQEVEDRARILQAAPGPIRKKIL